MAFLGSKAQFRSANGNVATILGDSLVGLKQLVVVGATSDELDSETESKVAEGSLTASLSLQCLAVSLQPSNQPFERAVLGECMALLASGSDPTV